MELKSLNDELESKQTTSDEQKHRKRVYNQRSYPKSAEKKKQLIEARYKSDSFPSEMIKC